MKPRLTQINRERLELVFCRSQYSRVVIDYIPGKTEEEEETVIVVNGVNHRGDTIFKDAFAGYEVIVSNCYHEFLVFIKKEKL